MTRIRSVHFQFWVPVGTFLIFSVTLLLLSYLVWKNGIDNLHRQNLDTATFLFSSIQSHIAHHATTTHEGHDDLDKLLTRNATMRGVQQLALFDANLIVLSSNQLSKKQLHAEQAGYRFVLLNQNLIRLSTGLNHVIDELSNTANIYGLVNLQDQASQATHIHSHETLRPDKKGILFMQFDLSLGETRVTDQLFNQLIFVWVIGLVGSLLMIKLVTHFISNPAKRLSNYATKLANGDYEHDLEIRGHGEFAQLAQSLDAMSRVIVENLNLMSQHKNELELEVSARTRELNHEKSNAESAQKVLQSVIDSLPIRVYWKKTDLSYAGCNTLFARDAGFDSTDAVIGIDDYSLPWKSFADDIRQTDLAILKSNLPKLAYERTHIAADGSEVWLNVNKIPLKNLAGEVTGVLGSYEDITDKKMAARALESAQLEAVKANRLKSAFLANMSHEIRTPMNAIIGLTYQALQTDLNESQKKYIGKTYKSAQDLLHLLNDILDFSRIESGELHFESVNFRLEDVVDNTLELVSDLSKKKSINITLNMHPDTPTAFIGDPARIGQILLNIVNNALKFSHPNSSIEIGIKPLLLTPKTCNVHFWVKDEGIGMNEDSLDNLFDAFAQADSSTTRLYGGTGLGLSICKNLLDKMFGAIWVETQPNQGSTFHFSIPLGVQMHVPSPRQRGTDPATSLQQNIVKLQGAKVLLVEDNEINRELAVELLESNGLIVSTATNGKLALDMLSEQTFDGVLMDCQMPVMDGYQATRFIREKAAFKQLPVLAFTANVLDHDRKQALDAGMNDVITKPVEIHDLFARLAKWITPSEPKDMHSASALARASGTSVDLPAIPGVDFEQGLTTFAQNKVLYRKLLIKFRTNYQNLDDMLTKLLDDKKFESAKITAHSIKGAAASLGMASVRQAAAELEQVCSVDTDPDKVHAAVASLLKVLDPILENLSILVEHEPQSPPSIDHVVFDQSQLAILMNNLATEIQASKISASSKAKHIRPYLRDEKHQVIYGRLLDALDEYDFDQAEIEFGQLAEQLQVEH